MAAPVWAGLRTIAGAEDRLMNIKLLPWDLVK